MKDTLLESWLELFVMVKEDKNSFKFGQLTMNIEVFEVDAGHGRKEDFIDVHNVKFKTIAEIKNKEEVETFLKVFETDMNDFTPMHDYELLNDVTFTGEARGLMGKATGLGMMMWVNNEWSDPVELDPPVTW